MFTTIAKLRASSAMQSRVTTVENWLKRQVPGYTPEALFPIAFIAHSNSVDDVEWVNGVAGTHVTNAELASEVLKEFGHKTQGEHRNAMSELLRSRDGKTKVLAEQIVPKYNAAFARTKKADFGSIWWPMKIEPQVAAPAAQAEPAAVEANLNPAASTGTDLFKPLAQVAAESGMSSPETVAPEANEDGMYSVSILGAMYIGLGRVMMGKEKTFEEAVTYSTSPTGGRVFSDYVQAFASGVELKDVRACLKTFASNMA